MLSQDATLSRYSQEWFEQEYLPSYGIDPQQPSIAPLAGRYHHELAPLERFRQNGRLLDVGAGAGLFLAAAQATGWDVAGVEIAEYGSIYARKYFGLSIYHGTLAQAKFPDNYFDVVMLQDTIEHVSDPRGLLQEVCRIVRPGGATVLTTPNFDSLSRHLIGCQWALISPAEHVHLFNRQSLRYVLETTGFILYALVSDANTNLNLIHGPKNLPIKISQKLLQLTSKSLTSSLLYKLVLGDELHAVAVKPIVPY